MAVCLFVYVDVAVLGYLTTIDIKKFTTLLIVLIFVWKMIAKLKI